MAHSSSSSVSQPSFFSPYLFNDGSRSISVFDPDLLSPWINYLSNGSLHAFVSQTGGGSLWWRSPMNFRITRYRGWPSQTDGPGFYLYVREQDGTTWSPSYRPCETKLDRWEATHAPGSSRFTGRRGDLEVSQRLFVAPDSETLVWDIDVTNHGAEALSLDLFGYAEVAQLEPGLESTWGYYVRYMFKTWFEQDAQLYLYHHQSHPRLADLPLVFFASDRPVTSYSGDRQQFLGRGRSERNPQAVEKGHCGNGSLSGGDPCSALQVPLTVAPGQTERVALFLGVIPGALKDFEGAKRRLADELARLRTPGFVEAQSGKLEAWWAEHFKVFDCQLPDPDCERQIRTWTPVNCVHTGRYSRSFSQAASGMRGFGFRDTAQDMLALVARRPEWVRAEFLRLLSHQFADGHAVHTYYPEDAKAPAMSVHSDDHLWLPLLAYALVAETGDLTLLSAKTPYLAANGLGPGTEATVWEHLLAALDFTRTHLGVHGLPLTLRSDWNDCIGRFARQGLGESVMVAQQYAHGLRQMIELAEAYGDAASAARFRAELEAQICALKTHAWDGEWWVRGFDDDTTPLGSKTCDVGQIWLNSQTWSVLADCGDRDQQVQAMDAVARILDTPRGIKKLDPSFPTFPEAADAFSGYTPGCGENGAIFCHANAWAVIAEALLGRPERAWKYFRQLVPHVALQQTGLDRYQCEPYAYASSILGPENPRFGLATLTHVTGTAAWMDVAGTQYLLGIRPVIGGLKFAPCLPEEWPGFTATRVYRGCELQITVSKGGVAPVAALLIDGQRYEGDTLRPEWIAGKTSVRVELVW